MTFRLRHLIAAVVLHAIALVLLAGGLQCSRTPQRPPVIRAVLLDPDRKELQQQRRREEQRRRDEEKKRAEEQRRRDEQQRRQQAEEQKAREAERLRQQQAEQARLRQQEETRRAAEQKKAEDEARRRKEAEEQRERQEAAQRELQAKAAMEQAMREEAIRRELEREQQARAATERDLKLAQWEDALTRHIARNWVRPPSIAGEFECTVRVQQLPDGTVTYAKIVKSCGNAPLDKSVEDAVFRSSPLPRPADPSIFERDLIINFIPES